MNTTKISKQSNDRIRTTLPRALAREIEIYDREAQHIRYAIRCDGGGGIALEATIGPDVDPRSINVVSPIVHKSGQVELELPAFQMEAWGLVDAEVRWPAPDDVDVDGSTATIRASIPGWEPTYDVDMFGAAAGFPYGSTISMSGGERKNIESAFPINPAEEIGLTDPDTRAEITFDCVDGRKVLVATPTDRDRGEVRNSLAVHLAGAGGRQARFNAGRVAAELDVHDELEEGSVRLRWLNQNGQLIGFVRPSGGD